MFAIERVPRWTPELNTQIRSCCDEEEFTGLTEFIKPLKTGHLCRFDVTSAIVCVSYRTALLSA